VCQIRGLYIHCVWGYLGVIPISIGIKNTLKSEFRDVAKKVLSLSTSMIISGGGPADYFQFLFKITISFSIRWTILSGMSCFNAISNESKTMISVLYGLGGVAISSAIYIDTRH
jgi:hypothetical protein